MSKFTMPEEAERDAIEDAGLTPIERVRLELHLSNEYLRAPELDGDDVEELLKAYDALRAAQEWQDISTAPKDAEQFILLFCPEDGSRWLASWQLGDWFGVDDFGLRRTGHSLGDPDNVTGWFVSHWQPLPKPPVAVIADHRTK